MSDTPLDRDPLQDRDTPGQRPPQQRPPGQRSPGQRYPHGQRPPPPGQRPPWTEIPREQNHRQVLKNITFVAGGKNTTKKNNSLFLSADGP